MSTTPRRHVEAPAVAPRTGGLLSVALFPPSTDHFHGGVEYHPRTCTEAAFTVGDPCDWETGVYDNGLPDLEVPDAFAGRPLVTGDPIHVYAGFRCSSVGVSLEDQQALAEAALANGESRAVEYRFWMDSLVNPVPDDPDDDSDQAVVLNGGVATDPVCALGLLEGYLAKEYAGTGVIHAPAELSSAWSERTEKVGSRIQTELGTPVAYGGGYSEANVGPTGVAAPAGTYWAYATGAVAVWRDAVDVGPKPTSKGLNRTTNEVAFLASRTYVVTYECVKAAVLVALCS